MNSPAAARSIENPGLCHLDPLLVALVQALQAVEARGEQAQPDEAVLPEQTDPREKQAA